MANMNEAWECYVKWNKTLEKQSNTFWFYYIELLRAVKLTGTETTMVAARCLDEGEIGVV